jgi:dethiobiotin synthetase
MGGAVFVTGTGTDVGKTYVTALMVRKLARHGKRPGYYKAAISGNVRREDGSLIPGDALWVQTVSGIAQPLEEMCPYVYEHAWSPHLAARAEGNPVELDVVNRGFQAVRGRYDYVTVEGSGGILCPLRFDQQKLWLEDVVRALGLSCVLVADAGLGTINSVVLTAEHMNQRSLPVKGVIFNHFHPGDLMEEDNLLMCRERTGLPVLATVKDGDTELDMDIEALTALYE